MSSKRVYAEEGSQSIYEEIAEYVQTIRTVRETVYAAGVYLSETLFMQAMELCRRLIEVGLLDDEGARGGEYWQEWVRKREVQLGALRLLIRKELGYDGLT